MKSFARHQLILDRVALGDSILIDDLVTATGASPSTVRRDIRELERSGQVVSLRGGAIRAEERAAELPAALKSQINRDEKVAIARAAAAMVVEELRSYCANVVLTLGSHGCYVSAGRRVEFVGAVEARAVDTTGAGDSFIGAFATALAGGVDPFQASRTAALVASITVAGMGAQSSMPTREDLDHEVVRETPADPRPGRAG